MSKKRDVAESSNDELTKEDDSGSIFHEDDDAKRSKLEPLSDTTLQHLPIEMLEYILAKAVAMEVLELKVARCARKEQADLVIGRLGTVCSQWNWVLTTDIFKKKVHSILEGQETIRFEILDQPTMPAFVHKLTTLKDEIFLLCSPLNGSPLKVINVYDRNNMAEVKDVIPLQGISPGDMATCIVTNRVYILNAEMYRASVFRITRDEEHHFKVSEWLPNLRMPVTSPIGPISVSDNGNLIILSSQPNPVHVGLHVPAPGKSLSKPSYIGIYCTYGFMQHRIMLYPDLYGARIFYSVIQKSNGNLVLLAADDANNAKLLEIDTIGGIQRQYQSSLHEYRAMSFADVYGRILVTDYHNSFELFDTEFNLLEIAEPRSPEGFLGLYAAPQIHFNRERNELVRLEMVKYNNDFYGSIGGSVLSIFRFTNE